MIITICSQATSEERTQLMTLVCRITGNLHPITTTVMDGHELLVLDATHIDAAAQALLREQPAVERVTRVKTAYKLVSRAFKAEDTTIQIGAGHDCEQVTLGGASSTIIAGRAWLKIENNCSRRHTRSNTRGRTCCVEARSSHAVPPIVFRGWGLKA